MMFKRRKRQPVHHRVSNLIWPRMGWGRVFMYLWHRVGRLHGTPHSIAGGLACGAAVSFTPFVGVHFILAALFAWFSRSNIVAGLIGTAVGNPWTFPFIWWWTYTLGRKMGAGAALHGREPDFLSIFTDLFGVLGKAVVKFQLDAAYFENVWTVIWPMMIGSLPTFILVWLGTYMLLKPLVTAYQARRIARRRRKLKRQREARAIAEAEAEADTGAEAEADTGAESPDVATLPLRPDAPFAGGPAAKRKSGV